MLDVMLEIYLAWTDQRDIIKRIRKDFDIIVDNTFFITFLSSYAYK